MFDWIHGVVDKAKPIDWEQQQQQQQKSKQSVVPVKVMSDCTH
jgi:hypothetical protein